MSAPSNRRSDYRERIRLARERVQAAEAAESSNQHGNRESSRDHHASAHGMSAAAPQMKQGNPQSPPRSQRPLAPASAIPIPVRSQDQAASRPPPRPYRPDNNSWFATGPSRDPHQTGQPSPRRDQATSHAQTDSIYSQTESVDNNTTAGPSRSSYVTVSHPTSHHSSVSSIGDIPEFPVPQIEDWNEASANQTSLQPASAATHTRRVPNFGPPPAASARRGASSLYSHHQSYVSPIPEESPQSTPRMDRFSTIAALESSLGPVDERFDHTFLEDPSDDSNQNTYDPNSDMALISPGLLRQASLGRKARPSQILVRSGSSSAGKGISPESSSEAATPTMRDSAAAPSSHLGFTPRSPAPPMPGQTAVSSEHGDSMSHPASARSVSPMTPVMERIIGGLEKGGALPEGVAAPALQDTHSSRPRPDGTFAQNREDRVSTTSLADMIRRATKVRTNLDRGKTASRLGMLDMFNNRSRDKLNRYDKGDRGSVTDSMFSGLIGWLPTQGHVGDQVYTEKALEEGGPSRRAIKEKVRRDRRKRCCGMPQWLFFLLLVLIIACIAAAIIVPVELLVVPHQSDGTGVTLTNCPSQNSCHNSGTSVVFNGTCSCACVNGFTGKNCEQEPDAACASDVSNVPNVPGNATMGKNVTSLIGQGPSFNIPLNATALVGAFSYNGLSCSDENALVMLGSPDNANLRRSLQGSIDSSAAATPTPAPKPIMGEPQPPELKRDVVTSASLDFAATYTPTASPTATGNSTGASTGSTASPTSANAPSQGYFDFARIATLFILQETGDIQIAEQAHSDLQQVFNSKIFVLQKVNVTSGVSVDMNTGVVTINGITKGTGNGIH